MSTNLYYEVAINREKCIGYAIKFILAPLIWEQDGSLSSEQTLITKESDFWELSQKEKINIYSLLIGLSTREDEVGKEAKDIIELLNKYPNGILLSLKG